MDNETRLELLRQHRAAIVVEAKSAGREYLTNTQDPKFRAISSEIEQLSDDVERSNANSAAALRIQRAHDGRGGQAPSPYDTGQHSHVRDLLSMATPAIDPHGEARARLASLEQRDVAGQTTVVGAAGTFSPPQYLLNLYAQYARLTAPLYSLLQRILLEGPVTSTPKLTSGTSASVQSTQNTSISTTEFVDEYISVTAKTIAAGTVVSEQLLTLSPVQIDATARTFFTTGRSLRLEDQHRR